MELAKHHNRSSQMHVQVNGYDCYTDSGGASHNFIGRYVLQHYIWHATNAIGHFDWAGPTVEFEGVKYQKSHFGLFDTL